MPQTGHFRVGLAPDGLAKRERGLQRGRGAQEHGVPRHGTRMIVDHARQPRAHRRPVRVEDQEIQLGVVGLPERIGPLGTVAVDQFETAAEGGLTLMSEDHQGGVQGSDDLIDAAVGGGRRLLRHGQGRDPPMDAGDGRGWLAQGESLDHLHPLRRQLPVPAVGARRPCQSGPPLGPIPREPALRSPERDPRLARGLGQGHAVVQMRTQNRPAHHRFVALGPGRLPQGWFGGIFRVQIVPPGLRVVPGARCP
jgi:hypothetical protein